MKMVFRLLVGLISLLGFTQDNNDALSSLDSEIENLMKAYQTPGLSIAIIQEGKIIYEKGFGYENLKSKLPVDQNTIFPIGSVTKPFTAALIGILQDQGKISIAERPKEYIPYLEFYNDEMNNLIAIKDLLSHRSGIGVVDGTHVFFPTNSLKTHLKRLKYLAPNSEVRERFDYSNMGYVILGGIVEESNGMPWDESLKRLLFEPLEMKNSSADLRSLKNKENSALGYSVAKDSSVIEVLYEDQFESVASGAINSSISDITNWMLMLLNKGKFKGTQIISQEYLEHSFSEKTIILESFRFKREFDLLNDAYGYGWFTHNYKGLLRVNHEGNVSGFTSSINLYPHKNVGVAILCNQGSANMLHKTIVDLITSKLLGLPSKKWNEYEVLYGQAILPKVASLNINEDKKPTHPIAQYCGNYKNKCYGSLAIVLEEG
mgnify:CR=1 FL=1